MKTAFKKTGFLVGLALLSAVSAFAQAGRIYTQPDPADTGAIAGRTDVELTHAVAVEQDRVRVFLGDLTDEGRAFRFGHLPVGKYDIVFFTKSGTVYEGLALGAPKTLEEASARNLNKRISLADGFFNRYCVHRTGVSADGETTLAFVERFRANNILQQSGEALGQMVRRFEVIELTRATDDWQLTSTRHIYREGEPISINPQFHKVVHLPSLGGVRMIATPKDLGIIPLPQ